MIASTATSRSSRRESTKNSPGRFKEQGEPVSSCSSKKRKVSFGLTSEDLPLILPVESCLSNIDLSGLGFVFSDDPEQESEEESDKDSIVRFLTELFPYDSCDDDSFDDDSFDEDSFDEEFKEKCMKLFQIDLEVPLDELPDCNSLFG